MTLDSWQQWEGRVVGGRYALLQHLGGSDHGAVYLTEFGGARAVVKLVPEDASDAPAQLARWEAACNLAHANLLRVYETGRWHADDEHDMFFAVMEFADENLGDVVGERALTAAEAREMLGPTIAALEYLHGRNLVHGCLKPSNVMAVGAQLKLAVDGVRRSGTRLTSAEQEDWRAVPEVFNAGVSWRNDVWALGLLLVESLTQQKPKVDKSGEVAVQLPEDLPEPFKSIAQGCLQRDPAKRCSLAEVRRMLERPTEPVKAPAQVVPIRVEEKAAEKPEAKAPAGAIAVEVKPEAKPAAEPEAAVEASLPTYEYEVPKRNGKFLVLAAAIVVAIVALVALVRYSGRHTSEAKPLSEVAAPADTTARVQPAAATATISPRSSSGAVAKEVMPEVSRVAQNSIHGVVKVRVQVNVNEAGEVTLAGLSAHGPSRYFAKQALDAARQWIFTAPVVDGKATASRWMIEFDFKRSGVKAESRMVQAKG